MLTPVNLQRKLTSAFTDRQATLLTEVIHDAYSDLVHTGDFNELKELVHQVVVLQVETGSQIKELTVAQQRTEQRLEELASAQKGLTSAQQLTEQRIAELTSAQRELTTSQRNVQRTLNGLTKQVGGLSDRFGGDIEDAARGIVYFVLTVDLDCKVKMLEGGLLKFREVEEEIDLYGQIFDPKRPGTDIWLIGEVKFNITRPEAKRFAAKIRRIRATTSGEVFPVIFSYRLHPEVLEAIREEGAALHRLQRAYEGMKPRDKRVAPHQQCGAALFDPKHI